MATNFKPWEQKGEYGTYYLFDEADDGIAMHAHVAPENWHDTRCLAGSVAIYGDGLDIILKAGETANFKSYRQHELRALEPRTEIVNVWLAGKPPGYEPDDPTMTSSVISELKGRITYG